MGTQFHPEWNRLEQPRFQGFFDNLVNDGQLFAEGKLGAPASSNPVPPPAAEASPRVLVHS